MFSTSLFTFFLKPIDRFTYLCYNNIRGLALTTLLTSSLHADYGFLSTDFRSWKRCPLFRWNRHENVEKVVHVARHLACLLVFDFRTAIDCATHCRGVWTANNLIVIRESMTVYRSCFFLLKWIFHKTKIQNMITKNIESFSSKFIFVHCDEFFRPFFLLFFAQHNI